MKTPHDQHARRSRAESHLEATIGALFRRQSALYGFTVQRASDVSHDRVIGQLRGDLQLADVAAHQWPGMTDELCDDIGNTLLGLLDDRPEAVDLLAGRTFARALA
jgi:hypothetical protein